MELAVGVNDSWVKKLYGVDRNGAYGGLQGIGGLLAVADARGLHGVAHDIHGHVVGRTEGSEWKWSRNRFGGYGALPGSAMRPVGEGGDVVKVSGWQGKRADATGYVWMGARYYDPASGRFLSPDPLGHGSSLNLYDYANGDPINRCDPDGRFGRGFGESGSETLEGVGQVLSIVLGSALYHVTGLFSQKWADALFGGSWGAMKETVKGLTDLGKQLIGGNVDKSDVKELIEDIVEDFTGTAEESAAKRLGRATERAAEFLIPVSKFAQGAKAAKLSNATQKALKRSQRKFTKNTSKNGKLQDAGGALDGVEGNAAGGAGKMGSQANRNKDWVSFDSNRSGPVIVGETMSRVEAAAR